MMQPTKSEINELLFRLLDNEVSDQEFVSLRQWLDSDVQAKRYYCQFMTDYGALSLRTMTSVQTRQDVIQDELLDENFWDLMSQEEQRAPAVEILVPELTSGPDKIQKVCREPIVRTVNKTSLLVAVVSLAALLVMIASVVWRRRHPLRLPRCWTVLMRSGRQTFPCGRGRRLRRRPGRYN